jgi:16S rRNA processing protein RimM
VSQSGPGLTPAGIIVGAQGVRGLVRVKTFTQTSGVIADYGPLFNESGERQFNVTLVEARPTVAVLKIDGVTSREAAEALKGLMLHIPRSALPEVDEDEFYHADLVGLIAETEAEGRIGVVSSLDDFGAGELIEIALDAGGAPLVCPFTMAVVPIVDIAGGKVVLNPPAGLWPRETKAKHTGPAKSGKRKRPKPVEGEGGPA